MDVTPINRKVEYKYPEVEEEERSTELIDQEEAQMQIMCKRWGVERAVLAGHVITISALHSRIEKYIWDCNALQAEELQISKSIQDLMQQKEKIVDINTSLPTEKLQQAQTKLAGLMQKLTDLEAALKKTEVANNQALKAFQAASHLRRNYKKSSQAKTRLNKEWPDIQKANSTAATAYKEALAKRDTCQAELIQQRSRVHSLEAESNRSKASLMKIEKNLAAFSAKLQATQKNREALIHAIGALSVIVGETNTIFIEANMSSSTVDLKNEAKAFLKDPRGKPIRICSF